MQKITNIQNIKKQLNERNQIILINNQIASINTSNYFAIFETEIIKVNQLSNYAFTYTHNNNYLIVKIDDDFIAVHSGVVVDCLLNLHTDRNKFILCDLSTGERFNFNLPVIQFNY